MLLYMTSFRLSRTFSKVFDVFTGPSLYSATFYFITLSSVCQEVFQLFSFARLPLISDNFWIVTHCLAFVNSFLNFFKFLSAAPRISRAAWLEYQTLPHLSTPFFKFYLPRRWERGCFAREGEISGVCTPPEAKQKNCRQKVSRRRQTAGTQEPPCVPALYA